MVAGKGGQFSRKGTKEKPASTNTGRLQHFHEKYPLGPGSAPRSLGPVRCSPAPHDRRESVWPNGSSPRSSRSFPVVRVVA